MKASDLTGEQLNKWIAYIGINEARIYTRDMQVYTLPHLYAGHEGRLFIVAANTSLSVTPRPIPPKFCRSAAPVPFDPVNNATQGLPMIEHLGITVGRANTSPEEAPTCYASSQTRLTYQYGSTYLEAGLRAVVAYYYGDDLPDQVPL